jgi:cob(I)alamin adenosyltransferase
MQAADHARSMEFAQLGVMQALARDEERRVFDSLRKTATCRRSNKWLNRLVSTLLEHQRRRSTQIKRDQKQSQRGLTNDVAQDPQWHASLEEG